MLIFLALQQGLLSIARPLTITVIVSEVTCAQQDEYIKTQIFSASIFMAGLATFMVTTFGVRYQHFFEKIRVVNEELHTIIYLKNSQM
ncbi:unnamed protein product [Candidula unifasciata]|uniref:Uncharacterized protein n=1 Tax=Candidula unifasciata TaxID=100452 RepID=A0A8S3ZNS4_9EUPU|nr:unnamed protein product [Candidula unifasciata]